LDFGGSTSSPEDDFNKKNGKRLSGDGNSSVINPKKEVFSQDGLQKMS